MNYYKPGFLGNLGRFYLLIYYSDQETLSKTATDIGGKVIPTVCDHSDDGAVEQLFKQIQAENDGRLDFLVNNCYAAVTTLLGSHLKKTSKFLSYKKICVKKVLFVKNSLGLIFFRDKFKVKKRLGLNMCLS